MHLSARNIFKLIDHSKCLTNERVPLLQIVLSHKPRIFYFPNFFRHNDTMEYLARLSAGKLKDSVLDGVRHNPSVRNSKVAL